MMQEDTTRLLATNWQEKDLRTLNIIIANFNS